MKFVLLCLALSFLYKSADSSSVPNSCGDRARIGNKDWVLLCFPNPDKTLNVTFDCNLNSNEDDVHLQIWYPFYPSETKSLTIQNCNKLYLAFDIEPKIIYEPETLFNTRYVQLRHLHVKNISQFSMDNRVGTRCLPREVKFEHIQEADFSMPLISDDDVCQKSDYNIGNFYLIRNDYNSYLESLELFNLTIRNLPSNFIWERSTKSTKMERFYMRNCTIEKAERNAIVIPKSSKVEISQTTVKIMENRFIDIKADHVVIKENNFMNIPRKSSNSEIKEDLTTFAIKAKSVQISGNAFDFLGENSLEISSNFITIFKNVFKRIEENAFKNIGFSTKEPPRHFNFFYNLIYSLSPRSIRSPTEKLGPVDSDYINIDDNLVVCSCANLPWFDWLSRNPNQFNNKWFNEKLMNRCLKVSCGLPKISKNYSRLCDENYECSELPPVDPSLTEKGSETSDRVMVTSNLTKVNQTKNDNLNEFERLLTSLERSNNETFNTFKTNSEIIKLLRAESRKTNKN